MRRSFLRQTLVVLATCALFLPIALDYGVTAQAATVSVSDSSCGSYTLTDNGGGNFTLNCVPAAGGQFSVSLTASLGAPTVSQGVTLTATPQNQGGAVTYTWGSAPAGCPAITQEAGTPSKADIAAPGGQTAVGPCNYTVSASDGVNPNANANRNVSWSTSGGGGGGGGPINCSNVTGPTVTMDIPWPGDAIVHQYLTASSGTFTPDGAVVIRFTTSGAANSTAGVPGVIKGVEYQGSPVGRTGALSTQPCDFLGANAVKLSGLGCGKASFTNNMAPSEGLTQGATTSKCAAALQSGTTYYFNLSNSGSTCGAGIVSCPMIIYFQKAGGT